LLFHLLIFPPLFYTVVGVEMAYGAEKLQVIKMLFPLSEPVELSRGSVAVKGVDMVEL
jgi:hypothetical protein